MSYSDGYFELRTTYFVPIQAHTTLHYTIYMSHTALSQGLHYTIIYTCMDGTHRYSTHELGSNTVELLSG